MVKEHISNIGSLEDDFFPKDSMNFIVKFFKQILQTSLLFKVGGKEGEGLWLWLFALVTGDMRQVTCERRHKTSDM